MPQSQHKLAAAIKAKFPGEYDDWNDDALEKAIISKYPGEYDDWVTPETEVKKPEEGKSHGWLADTAYNFGKRFADIPHSLYETTQPAGFAKGTQELAELRKDPHALDAKMAQYKKDFESNLSSPGAWAKSALGEIDPTGTLPGYVDLAGQFAEDFRGQNVGGMGADAVLAALPFLIPSALRGIKKLRGVSTAGIDAAALPKGPSPYDVQRPPSPYDVERPPSPYDVPKVSPFNVERPPSPYDVPRPDYNVDRGIPPTNVPMPQTRMLPEPGANGSFIRGPRTARPEPNLLGPAQPYTGPRFMGSDIGQPNIDVMNPENLSTQGFPIDQTQAALGVTEPTRPFQPGIPKTVEGRVIPRQGAGRVFSPDYPAPITPEVLAPEPAPPVQPIQQPAAPVLAGTKVVPVPKVKTAPAPGSPEAFAARVRELKKLAKEQEKLAKAKKAEPQVQVVPQVEPVPVPEMQALPEVKPIVQEPIAPPKPVPIPPVEPVTIPEPVKAAPLPPVEPIPEPVKPVAEKPTLTPIEEKTLAEDLRGAQARYARAVKEYNKSQTAITLRRLNDARTELKAAANAKKTGRLRGAVGPAPELPAVEPITEPVAEPVKQEPARPRLALPTRLHAAWEKALANESGAGIEPDLARDNVFKRAESYAKQHNMEVDAFRQYARERLGPGSKLGLTDLTNKTIGELTKLAKTADESMGNSIREELIRRREAASKKGGTTAGSGFGSLQDAPRLLKQEFDEWRVLKNLPENQAAFEEFLSSTGKAVGVAATKGGFNKGDRVRTNDYHGNPVEGIVTKVERHLGQDWANVLIPDERVGYEGFTRRVAMSELEPLAGEPKGWIPPELRREVPKKQLFTQENQKIRESFDPNKFHLEIVGKSGKTVTPFDMEFNTFAEAEKYANRIGEEGVRIVEPRLKGLPTNPLSKLSTQELADAAKLAETPEETSAIRKEVARRRGGGSTTLSSGGLGEASSILKKEFDAWRVLRKLPENQEAFDLFLADTGRFVSQASRQAAGQNWGGTPKTAKLGKGEPYVEPVSLPDDFGTKAGPKLRGAEAFTKSIEDVGTGAEKPSGRTVSNINRGEGYYEEGAKRKNKLEPEPKPLSISERFAAGFGEETSGKSLLELQKEAADKAKATAEQAAAERAMAKEKADVAAQKEADRTAAKETRQAERQAKIDARKEKIAAKKAAEIPPAEVTGELGETTVQKARWGKFMKANPAFKAITDKLIKTRSADRLIGKKLRDQFKDIADIPKEKIIQFQEALAKGHYPEVRKFFDDMHADLTSKGIEMGEKENYLPQLWDNTAKEVRAAFGDKKMSEKASFQFRSFIEDYKTGIEDKGLTPKMSPIQLIEWYGKRANKLLADSTALKELKAQGYLRTKKLPGMQAMDENLGTFKYHYAEPAVKKVLENYLKSSDTQSGFGHAIAKGVGKVSSSILSAGVPKVPLLTFHGGGMTVRSLFEGGPRRVGQAIKFGLSPKRAASYIESNIDKMISRTQEFGANFGTESAPGQGEKFFTKEGGSFGRGTAKKAFNWLNDKQMELFEKPLFDKMLPALKHTAWEDNFAKFQKKGMDRAKAGAAATEVTDAFFSGKNVDLLYNDKNFNTAVRVLTLAPNWLRSTIDLGIKVPSSVVKILKDPSNPVTRKYLKAGATLAGTYAAANILQKATTGKFMVENSNADIFNFQLGKDANGKPRSFKLFGTAGDFAKVPLQIAMAGFKEGGWLEAAEGAIENRVSPLVQALISAKTGEDYQGNPNLFRTKDDFGRSIPIKERAKNTLSQLAGFGPAQISAPINYMLGKAGAEETLAKLTETALKYGKKKKVKPGAFGGPNLSGLSSIK